MYYSNHLYLKHGIEHKVPKVGEKVVIVLIEEHILCTYQGIVFDGDGKCLFSYKHPKYPQLIVSEFQVGLPVALAQSILN